MEKQVLSIEQMRELIEMGVDTTNASMIWRPNMALDENKTPFVNGYYLDFNRIKKDSPYWNTRVGKETIPTFTLQDMLELLPEEVDNHGLESDLKECVQYSFRGGKLIHHLKAVHDRTLLEATFKMLKWITEKK